MFRHLAASLFMALWCLTTSAQAITYWSLYENNAGGPTNIGTTYVTYNTLSDMLTDTNRATTNFLLGQNNALVGSGSEGST